MKITIPTMLSEISLDAWLKYRRVTLAPDIDDKVERLACVTLFCNLTIEQVMQIPEKDLKEIYVQIKTVLDFKPVFVQRFMVDGQEFGFIPNLDQMTGGEFMDLDGYFSDPETYARALSVMYRPITNRVKDMYAIEPYKGSDKYLSIMQGVNLEIALGSMVFFYRLGSELLKATRLYLNKPEIQAAINQASLSLNGDGTQVSTAYLEEIFLSLERQLKLGYMSS